MPNKLHRPSRLAHACLLACLCAAAATTTAAPRHAPRHAPAKTAPAAAPAVVETAPGQLPVLDNSAYVVMDYDSGEVLAGSNADTPLPPASLTKMMTSYIVEQALKAGRLKPTDLVHVSENAWCRGSSVESCMYLPLGADATVIDILRGIVIQSGNDASKAIAEHMASSESGFAQLMNNEAARIGMTHTHFVNPTGLPAADHKASAHDLALLARAIIRDSAAYYPIYAEREFKYNGIKQGNRNALLYTDPTVDGLKTGHTDEAGFCMTTSAKRNGLRLITVVMGAKSMQARADQSRALFGWGFGTYEKAKPFAVGTSVASVPVDYGVADQVRAGIQADWAITVPRGQSAKIHTEIVPKPGIEAPVAAGAVLGKVVASIDGKPLGEMPLVALEPVERSGFMRRLWQHLHKMFGK